MDRVGQKYTSMKKDNELSFFSLDQSPVKNETSYGLSNLKLSNYLGSETTI